jgi:hypothetical protein
MRVDKCLMFLLLQFALTGAWAQSKKPVYHPCFLIDSVDAKMNVIRINAAKIFNDTFDCRQTLMDSIASRYLATKDNKYLDLLTTIRQNPLAHVDNLYPDVIKRFVENDFGEFINRLYLGKGKYAVLEKELIGVLNMIVNARPLKQKYMGLLNVEIDKAKDDKDKLRQAYFEKLKLRIEEEKYR